MTNNPLCKCGNPLKNHSDFRLFSEVLVFFVCLVLVEKTFHWQESRYPGLFCVKPTLKGHTNIALASPIGFFRERLRTERFFLYVEFGADQGGL